MNRLVPDASPLLPGHEASASSSPSDTPGGTGHFMIRRWSFSHFMDKIRSS